MKKTFLKLLIIFYLLISVIVTFCLIKFDNKILETKDKYYIILDKEFLNYEKGTLLSFIKVNNYDELVGKSICYINNDNLREGVIREINKDSNVIRINIGNEYYLKKQIIGEKNNIKSYGQLGTIISLLTNKIVYLISIIIPIVLLIIYEIFMFGNHVVKRKKR